MSTDLQLTSAPPPTPRAPRMDRDRASAALLVAATVAAVAWVNSPVGHSYGAFWGTPVGLSLGSASIQLTLHSVVNDALMAVFFFAVGLEVKDEVTIGQLSERARAVVPAAAALGGLAAPALIFLLVAGRSGDAHAWGVVISTDTAFLIGALALIRPRHPARLRVFLLTMAVVDDVGALTVIALFYTAHLRLGALLVAALTVGLIALVRFLPSGRGPVYGVLAVVLWFALHAAGVHPTLTGVAVALLIPVFAPRRRDVENVEALTRAFRQSPNPRYAAAATRGLRESISINERLQVAVAPFVSFVVLPVFALSNAGVPLDAGTLRGALRAPLFWGVVLGLVVGKLVGITGATALVDRSSWGRLAPGLRLRRVAGGAALSGIGFTIALLIADIAIPDPVAAAQARVGVLVASVLAAGLGWALLAVVDRWSPPVAVGKTLLRPFDAQRDHYRGRPDAPMVIVEYGDFECPFCSRATGSVDEVLAELGDDVVWVWRHLPLVRVHPHAREAAEAAEAADRQGRFLDLAQVMFARQDHLEREDLLAYADELGMDVDRFARDLEDGDVSRRVQDDVDDADLMDLLSTPTFFVNGKRHVGPYDAASLVTALRAPLHETGTTAPVAG